MYACMYGGAVLCFSVQELDRIFIATNVAKTVYERNNTRSLARYEFLESIVRTALAKYYNTKITTSQSAAVSLLLEKHLLPNADRMDILE